MTSNRIKVLLVDDERSLREPLQKYLGVEFGFEVDSAADYDEAMNLVCSRQGQYDVALIDRLLIPSPNGIQLMRDIKSSYPEIECIIATGWGREERQLALQEGAFRYIEKPFDYEELETLIRIAAQQVRLRAISRDIISRRDLESVLQRITAAVRSLAQADDAEIQLVLANTGAVKSYGRLDTSYVNGTPVAEAIQQLTQQTFASGKAEVCANLIARPNLPSSVEQGFPSLICVPIPGQQGNLGVLLAYGRRPSQFDQGSDIGLLQTLAGQAGLAIANAMAFEETRTHAGYMEALVYATGQLTQTTDLEQQLQLAWDFVCEQLQTPVFLVAFYDKECGLVKFPILFDKGKRIPVDPIGFEEAAHTTITGHVIKTGKEFFAPTGEVRRQKCTALQIKSTTVGDPCESCLCLPLMAGGDVLGAISVQAYEPHAFSPALLGACRALANHLATAITNSRLMEQTRRRANDLRTLLNLSLDVASSLELQQVMDRICKAATEFFQAEHSGLVLFEPALDFGRVVAEYPADCQAIGLRIPLFGVPDEELLLSQREPLVIPDVATRQGLGPLRDILLDQLNIHSTLIVPVMVKEQLLGSFSIDAIGKKRRFTAQEVELAKSFAAQVAVAIDHARLFDEAQSRARLLTALDESSRHIRAEKDPERLMHEIVRLAAELVGCQSGCVARVETYRQELEIIALHQMPPHLRHRRVAFSEGSLGLAARSGEGRSYSDYGCSPYRDPVFSTLGFNFAVVTPLRTGDEVTALLFLADPRAEYKLTSAAEEALERFVSQAAIALHTSQFLTAEQRAMAQQRILLKVSDYIQAADDLDKILHIVLTGVTAGYGLGFNRAALLLLDDDGKHLIGRLGIGHYDESKAQRDWQVDHKTGQDTFGRYLDRLEKAPIQQTPIGQAIRDLSLPLTDGNLFADIIAERRYRLVHRSDEHELAQGFIAAFQPESPLIVVPLTARGRAIGLLVADNKFTHAPITDELLQSLLTYANTAAIAIENRRLYEKSQNKLDQVERIREAASVVAQAIVQQDLRQTLDEIARRTQAIMSADAVTIYALGGTTPNQFVEYGFSIEAQRSPRSITPPDELKIPTSSPCRLLDITEEPYYRLAENGIFEGMPLYGGFTTAEGIRAAIGIQLRASERKMGVMYVNFRTPHHFSKEEISTIQLFADQAAAAIRNKQLYDEADRRATVFRALYDAGRTISAQQTLRETLNQIATQALMIVRGESGNRYTCQIVLKYGNRLQFAATSPPTLLAEVQKELMKQLSIATPVVSLLPGDRTGIVGRVALTGKPELLGNASADPEYIRLDPKTRSELAVPMKLGDEVIGVINLEAPFEEAFLEEDLLSLELLAAQAAVATRTAWLNEQTQLVAAIGREANSLELRPFLDSLFERLNAPFAARYIPVFLNLGIFNSEKGTLELIDSPYYPVDIQIHERSLNEKTIMVWVAKHRERYYAPNVMEDEHYNSLLPETRSEFATPILYGDELLGVLNLESPVLDAFSPEDRNLLEIIAHQIASTLHNVKQYEDLKRAQGLVGSRTTLAWMGMISNIYRHVMTSSAAIIRDRLQLLRADLRPDLDSGITQHLESMERVAQRIMAIPLTAPLSSEEGVECFPLCEFLTERVKQLQGRDRFRDIEFVIRCGDFETGMVRASREWIRILIDLLCDNAADAMDGLPSRRLIIQGALNEGRLNVFVEDTGKGIAEPILKDVFERPVPKKKDEKGMGMGLLMAQLIVEAYGGGIKVCSTGENGTILCFWLPAVNLSD